jgi:DNA-binding IclR family transcriptional regulator
MIKSVEKALRILQALDANQGWVGVRELGRKVGLYPATTHNILTTLRELSFVEFNIETRRYRLGVAATYLGQGADPLNSLRLFARPYIEALAKEFDETVVVLSWRNDLAIVVDWIQAAHPLAVTHVRGIIEHPILLASGRVLLAFQPRAVQLSYAAHEKLSQLGTNSPPTTEDMLQLLERVAGDGYAITKNVANTGIAAVAAPVFDTNHRILMAIGCSEPISRSTDEHLRAVRKRILEMSTMMTQRLGGTIGGHPPTTKDTPG